MMRAHRAKARREPSNRTPTFKRPDMHTTALALHAIRSNASARSTTCCGPMCKRP
jgi:hypothetical protein